MTSSLRNSLHRRNHKERSQLANRSKLGILEKHKDYVLRAKDYHKKQDRIKRLKQKAEERNKDEFYFGMNKQKTKGGVHVHERGNQTLPVDMVKILKSQDENYVRTMRTAGMKKIEKIKGQLMQMANLLSAKDNEDSEQGLDELEISILQKAGVIQGRLSNSSRSRAKNHIVFVEDQAEAKRYASSSRSGLERVDISKSPELTSRDLGWKTPVEDRSNKSKSRKSTQSVDPSGETAAQDEDDTKKNRGRLLKELSARLTRDTQLRYAIRELEMQRLLMGKGSSKRVRGLEKVEGDGGGTDEEEDDGRKTRKTKLVDDKAYKPRVYKWKVERKR